MHNIYHNNGRPKSSLFNNKIIPYNTERNMNYSLILPQQINAYIHYTLKALLYGMNLMMS